jgi:hypothetical protein
MLERKRLPDDPVDIERHPFTDTVLECRANAFNHVVRTMAIGGNTPERFDSLLKSRRRAVKKPQTGTGGRNDGA